MKRIKRSINRCLLAVIILSFIFAFAMAVAGCQKKAEPKKKPKKVVKIKTGGNLNYMIGEPVSIDPLNLEDSEGLQVSANLFDSLVRVDPKTLALKPAVAESWKANKDATIWTFKLRKGTKFHHGREVEAADFKYAWERICRPDSLSTVSYHLAAVEGYEEMKTGSVTELTGVQAKDKYTLEVKLRHPYADFDAVVSHPTLAPVPREEVEKDPAAFAEKPVGNGPFKMSEPWKHNEYIKVERFEDYYGQKAYLDTVTFRVFDSPEAAFPEFEAGNLDFTAVPITQVETVRRKYGQAELEAKPGQSFLSGSDLSVYYLAFNLDSPLWKDKPELRRAVSLSINREAISQAVYENTRDPATGIIPPAVPGFQPKASKYTKYDPAKAKELLAKAGFPDGKGLDGQPLKVQISTNAGYGHEVPAQIIEQNLKDVGIDAVINTMEDIDYLDALNKGQVDFFRLGYIADYPVMDNFLYPLFSSDNIPTEANGWTGDNRSRYANPEFDKLIKKARKETDRDKRIKLYRKAERMVLDEAVIVPIVFYCHSDVVAKKVKGLIYSPQRIVELNTVWLQE